ncbi:MAG: glycine cleavage system aminomethyltransferase GcvT [Phycisphaerales bacterium]|nr:glycine cleavage system aminomethyltransferase GcvT [Phycisphaerales bacterium]
MHESPLHAFHLKHNAQMVPFAGWTMPIRYAGIVEEHKQVRSSGGIFDVSHMGRVKVSGRHARRLLERLCSRRVHDMQPGQCRYSLMCNDRGGVRDDVIVYRHDDDEFTVVVNGANREKMLGHFEQVRAAGDLSVKIDDTTMKTAMVAIQGPKVMGFVGKFSTEIPTLKRYRFTVKNLVVAKLTVSRTGYTGEDGIEVILPAGMVDMALKLILKDVDMDAPDALVKPAGLGSRDSLRLEAGMPLYGHELGEEINALSCGVDFAISLDKDTGEFAETFIGMEALKKVQENGGPRVRLVGLAFEGRRTPRQDMPVKSGEREVGKVTSGCLSPTLDRPIAMALVNADVAAPGTRLQVDAGRAVLEGEVVSLPFYKAPKG